MNRRSPSPPAPRPTVCYGPRRVQYQTYPAPWAGSKCDAEAGISDSLQFALHTAIDAQSPPKFDHPSA